MPILKKNPAQVKTETKAPAQGTNKNPVKGPAKDAFAQKIAETEAGVGSGWVPPHPGTFNALITEAQLEQDGDKLDAYIEFTIVEEDDDEVHGKTARRYYNFVDDAGEEKGGVPFFKGDLQMLGIDTDEEITSMEKAAEVLAALVEEQKWVVIDVKKKGKYTNIFLNSVPENQDEKPANPNE